jgi:hypothetical protein
MLKNGKPWFPWGVYMQEATAGELANVSACGFNTILAYEHGGAGLPSDGHETNALPVVRAFLDRAAAADLQVVYAMNGFYSFPPYNESRGENWTTSVVSTFKDHPALAIYYIVDERPLADLPAITNRRDIIRKLDPHHATYAVLEHAPTIPAYVNVSDALGIDPYPWEGRLDTDNLTLAWDAFGALMDVVGPRRDKVGICVTQYFGWQNYDNIPSYSLPPAAALRSMVFAAIARGCKGVLLYSFYDLFQTTSPFGPYQNRTRAAPGVIASRLVNLKLLGREIAALEHILVQDVSNEHLMFAPRALHDGVVGGLRCPATGGGDSRATYGSTTAECTLILVNMNPFPMRVELAPSAITRNFPFAQQLAPFGVSVTSVPTPPR